jgi:regulator of chromosome condensation
VQDGEVFGWGTFRNMNGRWRFSPSIEIATTPQRVQIGDGRERIESIASGSDHAIAITLSGTVFSWGTAEQGRLGRIAKAECGKKRPDEELVPKKVSGLPPISMASCGLFSTMVVGRDGDVFAWGGNNCGQIALEGEGPYHYPHHVDALGPCAQVACGQHHSLALTHEGQVLSFGRTTYGRLGREDANAKADDIKSTPAPVDGIDSKVISVSAGPEVSGAVTDDHTALVWGNGQNHQLGQGEDAEDDKLKPTILQLEENSKQRKALSIAFGGQHTAVMVSSRDSSLGKRESAWTGQEKKNGPGKRARLS